MTKNIFVQGGSTLQKHTENDHPLSKENLTSVHLAVLDFH